MELLHLIDEFAKEADAIKAQQMSAYMRNQFAFLGIPTPLRKTICKEYFKEAKKVKIVDWKFVNACWENPYRELQYVAVDYLAIKIKLLTSSDIKKLKKLIVTKSWWDTVDGLDVIVGEIAMKYPEVNETLLLWSKDENIWLSRIAIDHQLSRKENTDTQLLEAVIVNNLGTSEFFIDKAIGWSLREYSKTNPKWVKDFIEKYREQLSKLSTKEGSKYI